MTPEKGQSMWLLHVCHASAGEMFSVQKTFDGEAEFSDDFCLMDGLPLGGFW